MKRKIIITVILAVMTGALFTGCAASDSREAAEVPETAETETAETETSGPEEAAGEEKEAADAGSSKDQEDKPDAAAVVLEDGIYTADFDTDSGMFHVSEACEGKGTLTVENGEMVIHVSLASKNIVNLFPGLAEDAGKDGAVLLEPTVDSVTYSDGITEEVYGFDVPVPVLEEEFDLALLGTKGTWYDHRVSVSNPEKTE